MIIRYTVNDNDYRDVIKPFYKHIKFDNGIWTHKGDFSKKDMEELTEFENLFEKYLYHIEECNCKDRERLEYFIKLKFDYFLNQIGEKDLIQYGRVDIVSKVPDKDENGECIYYFVGTDQIVVL